MTPYLSVVVAARNDNHGGDMLRRMQAFLDSWIGQAQRFDIPSEIVVVEWNPPADRPPLKSDLRRPATTAPCEVRFVQVPRAAHERFPHAESIPLHQMIAKNAGIRRARGEFVLATNLDIIFSEPLMRFFAERRLDRDAMYRMDRFDIRSDVPPGAEVDELLRFCETNVLRVFAREAAFNLDATGLPAPMPDDIFPPEAGLRLGRGWHAIERSDFEQYRWMDPEAEIVFDRPPNAAPRLLLDVEAGPSAGGEPVTLEVSGASTQLNGRALVRLHLPPETSSGSLRLRVCGRGLPLLRDPRLLNLRVLGIYWELLPDWLQAATIGERHIELAVNAPQIIRIEIRNEVGEPVFHASEPVCGSVRVNFDFGLPLPGPGWRLEIVRSKRPEDWSLSYHAPHPLAGQIRRAAYLHTHACGDFTLLSRDHWFALRGYPEFPIWPMHIDALLCYAAYHAGIREEILRDPLRIYHIEHLRAAGWTPEGEAARAARLEAKGVSEMQYSEFTKWVNQMRRFDAPVIFTKEDWGLGNLEFAETSLG